MQIYSWLTALFGGILIGLASSALLIFSGRVAGISGMIEGFFGGHPEERGWRGAFLLGLVLGGGLLKIIFPEAYETVSFSPLRFILAGILVGYGARASGGCTSGHGVCGLALMSPRSLVATTLFLLTGFVTVWALHHVSFPLLGLTPKGVP